ncbi:MAG: hypothetical protein R3F49_08805 [Planctomycetota bacterium]
MRAEDPVSRLDVAQDGGLFPREELLQAVAAADWRDRPAPLLAVTALAVGLGLLALATPIARPLAPVDVAWTAAGGSPWLHLPHALAHALSRGWSGFSVEQAWFAASALGLTLGFLALYGAARALRVGPLLALAAAASAAIAPACFMAAELPRADGFGVAGACLMLIAGLSKSERSPRSYCDFARRCIAAGAFALWLHAATAALALPLACELVARARHLPRDTRAGAVTRACGLGAAALALIGALGVWSWVARIGRMEALDGALAALAPSLGARALALWPTAALVALLFVHVERSEEERRTPAWLLGAALAGFAVFVIGGVAAPLIPLAALALANQANRRANPARAGRDVALAIVAALATQAALQPAVRRAQGSIVVPPTRSIEDARTRYIERFRSPSQALDRAR